MKLDSIVYDINTLSSAIQSDLINESTTFQAMYPSQTATEVVKTLASYSSMLQYMLVTTMANCYTDTAYSPTGIYQLAETLGNRLHGNISSQLTCSITRTNLTGVSVSIPSGSSFLVEGVNFFNSEDLLFPRTSDTINNVTLIQGEKKITEKIAHNIKGERFYFSDNFECNTNLVTVTVNGEKWNIRDSFLSESTISSSNLDILHSSNSFRELDSNTDDSNLKSFVLRTDPDGRSYLKCGNGSNGKIPQEGDSIKISWISNQGSRGNITKPNAEIILVSPIYYTTTDGKREQLEVECTNFAPSSGGFDTQSLETLKESSPYIFASGDRCVRRNDYKAMLLNKCGYLTCNVWGEYEQAIMEGTYNKIMMNMVYYSGIKIIQKYDLITAAKMQLDINSVENSIYTTIDTSTPAKVRKWYSETVGSTFTSRGFLGSYIIEVSSYDINNNNISLKYSDKFGTGILTCDYSNNKSVISNDATESNLTYENYIIDDLGPDLRSLDLETSTDDKIYIYNTPTQVSLKNQDESAGFSFKNDLFNVGELINPSSPDNKTKSDAYKANSNTYLFSGTNYNGAQTLLLPNNPIQILFTFSNNRVVENKVPNEQPAEGKYINRVNGGVISALIFKAPGNSELLKDFIGSFAVYGTTSNVLSSEGTNENAYINIKNDSSWVKLTDTINITDNLSAGDWTDWFTLNTFNPTTGEWTYYNQYCIEIYSFRDTVATEVTAGRRLAIGEIRAMYGDQTMIQAHVDQQDVVIEDNLHSEILPGRSSYIYYNNNNLVTLRLPYNNIVSGGVPVSLEDQNLIIPENLQYFKYNAVVQGATSENGYTTGQELIFTRNQSGGENLGNYCFSAVILDNTTGRCNITLCQNYSDTSSRNVFSQILYGKKQLTIQNGELSIKTGSSLGSGATISITSESMVTLYENYLGNFYSTEDIQRFDLPILDKYNHFTTYIEFKQPKIKNITVDVSIEYENLSVMNDVRNNVISEINKMFEITPYCLGKTFSVSDLWKTISLVPGVKRLIVNAPTDNITAMPYELISLPAANLTIRDINNYDTQLTIKD